MGLKILGISAFYHDSAAALIVDGEIIAAAQQERFSRIKHDEQFPAAAIAYCLEEAMLSPAEVDAVVFYDKPFLKFERILETYYRNAPAGLSSFISAMPAWLKEKLFIKSTLKSHLKEVGDFNWKHTALLFSSHHLSHAASAFYPSPFESSAVLTIDGVGEWATATIGQGKNNELNLMEAMHFPDSLGLLYSSFTYFLGFKVNSGEYKLMGLAPYGNTESEEVKDFIRLIKEYLITVFDDGSIRLNNSYFAYTTSLKMIKVKKWEALFKMPKREEGQDIGTKHSNLAQAIQQVTEEVVLKMAGHALRLTGEKNICLAGGVALNCVANGKLHRSGLFENIYIQPAAGDAGGALGAALSVYYQYYRNERKIPGDAMKGALLGPEYSERQIAAALQKEGVSYTALPREEIIRKTARDIAENRVVGWFQGRMEFGPRALGNRSILGSATDEGTQKRINLKIKKRESFRPFAPVMLPEEVYRYYDYAGLSPYMLLVQWLKPEKRRPLPENYYDLSLDQMLDIPRSEIPSVTHIDYSSRIQTAERDGNPLLYSLLEELKRQTGLGMMVNTSFNVRGEPIVCTPEEALHCFFSTDMDVLVIENFYIAKNQQH